ASVTWRIHFPLLCRKRGFVGRRQPRGGDCSTLMGKDSSTRVFPPDLFPSLVLTHTHTYTHTHLCTHTERDTHTHTLLHTHTHTHFYTPHLRVMHRYRSELPDLY